MGSRADISIHVPRAGYDFTSTWNCVNSFVFLSTYPVRGTTSVAAYPEPGTAFLSTYPVRGTTTEGAENGWNPCISIHVPRAGYDMYFQNCHTLDELFLSTYPVRGTTAHCIEALCRAAFLSTYPVRGTTHLRAAEGHRYSISIHVPRAGYDSGYMIQKDT